MPVFEGTNAVAVAFIDMSGFTSFTEVHGDDGAADLAESFAAATRGALREGDRLVKTIGDAVLIVSSSAARSVQVVERLTHASRGLFPLLRAGIAYGPAVRRGEDVYGATVNIASRLAAKAHPGHVLVTAQVAETAERLGLRVQSLGSTSLRNLRRPVDVFDLTVDQECHCGHVDPVCRVHVPRDVVAALFDDHQRVYRFCSTTCRDQFRRNPGLFSEMPACDSPHTGLGPAEPVAS